ncbi:MAG: carbohydrate ABC transporter permease, partial [Firmicutes bacterium]|nr:carbohydrate ABC transporter permease [Bacillota bacterium]
MKKLIIYAVLFAIAILMLMPFAWMVLSSFKEVDEVFTYDMTWLPSTLTLSGYYRALTEQPFLRYGLNSVWVSTIITILQLITSVLAGYAFSRLKFPGRGVIFMVYLS